MDFDDYQDQALVTDQAPMTGDDDLKSLMIPLLGLAGETGSLLTHYKRYIRDGEGYNFFRIRIKEELGDILWNVANIATKADLRLDEIATGNLSKTRDRWLDMTNGAGRKPFDDGYSIEEMFPRRFSIDVASGVDARGTNRALLMYEGRAFGDTLTDNSADDDGYRHHDVFHLAFLAHLGWSPVLRSNKFFNCKRRSKPDVDEIEDGGRAAVIDEAIAALVFAEAKKNHFYATVNSVEYSVLRTIKDLTAHLEVSVCAGREWEQAILAGFRVWRDVKVHGEGQIVGSLTERSLRFDPR